jgi:hypothetical protein
MDKQDRQWYRILVFLIVCITIAVFSYPLCAYILDRIVY